MSDRIKQILTSEAGRAMPTIAEHLAFETEISAEDAAKILVAAKADIATASAGAESKVENATRPSQGAADTANAGFQTGFGAVDQVGGPSGAEKTKATWSDAVARANSGVGAN